MKRKPTWLLSLVGASLLGGCASNPPVAETRIVPFAKIRDAADSANGYYALGRELQRNGKFDDAERAYRLALDMEPGHVDSRNGLAAIAVNRGDVDFALSILGSLAASHPDQPHLLANLGYAHYLKGNYFDARVALEQALSLDPANERTREKLRAVHGRLGLPDQDLPAMPQTQLALDPGPSAGEAAGIVAIGPGVYQLQPANTIVPAKPAMPDMAAAQVLVPVLPEPSSGLPAPAKVAELTPPPSHPLPEATGSVATASPASSSRASRLEIINGNGVPRLARTLRSLVHGDEWQVVRVANHGSFNVPVTRIEYARGNRESAEVLARGLQLTPVYRHNDALGDRLRVVLGYDLRSVDPLRQRAATGKLAAAE